MCGFGFMAYGFECCHRSIDFSLMPYIGQPKTKIKVKCKALKKSELKRQNKQFVKRLLYVNPVKHFCDDLEGRTFLHTLASKDILKKLNVEEWNQITAKDARTLVQSMPNM
nr:uncharacterized protein LOC108058249 [Drosophila takahashii]